MSKVHVVSFSGGRTSAFLVYLLEQRRKIEGLDVRFIFMDTGGEHEATYQFIKDIVKHWGIDLVCIRAVVNPEMGIGVTYRVVSLDELKPDLQPWVDMTKKYGAPTINAPRCTSRMKQEPHDKYCDDMFGKDGYITWLGIRQDEPTRLKHFQTTIDMFNKSKKTKEIRYLAELSNINKAGVKEWWSKQAFDLQLEEHLGNCVFCIKKATVKLIRAAQQEPEMAKAFNAMITDDSVRKLPGQKFQKGVIYRGHMSLENITKLAAVLPSEHLDEELATMSLFAEDEPTMCSESCEAIAPVEEFELVMQEDRKQA